MKFIAKLKIMFDRTKCYATVIEFVMIMYLFIMQSEFNPYFVILSIIIICIAVALIDFKYIFPSEQTIITEKNPVIMEMKKDIKDIKERV